MVRVAAVATGVLVLALSLVSGSGPDSAPAATPPSTTARATTATAAASSSTARPRAPRPAPFFAGPVYVLSASEAFIMVDPGEEEAPPTEGSVSKQRLKPAPGGFLGAGPAVPSILLIDGFGNFTAFFDDGRDLLDGSGDGPPGRAVFTAQFVRDGLPAGGGGADFRGAVVPSGASSSSSSSTSPARLALRSVRLVQYDAATRQLVLTAVAGSGTGFPAAATTATLKGVTLTFEAAPAGGAAAATPAVPEGPAASRAAAAALKAAKAAGWGGAGAGPVAGGGGSRGGSGGGSAVGVPQSMGGPRPVPRPVAPAAAASTVSVTSAVEGPR